MIFGSGLRILSLLFLANVVSCSSLSASEGRRPDVQKRVKPEPVADVVSVQPFSLAEGYRYDWRQERPLVKSGTLVVFRVDPELVYPRNTAERVLYAGSQTVQPLNHGHQSGHVIAIIPGNVDLTKEPVWFGSPGLPERVNAETIKSERAKAEKAGIQPFEAARIDSVTRKALEARNLAALLREYAAQLLMKHSPQEKALAETWRLPVAQSKPR